MGCPCQEAGACHGGINQSVFMALESPFPSADCCAVVPYALSHKDSTLCIQAKITARYNYLCLLTSCLYLNTVNFLWFFAISHVVQLCTVKQLFSSTLEK